MVRASASALQSRLRNHLNSQLIGREMERFCGHMAGSAGVCELVFLEVGLGCDRPSPVRCNFFFSLSFAADLLLGLAMGEA